MASSHSASGESDPRGRSHRLQKAPGRALRPLLALRATEQGGRLLCPAHAERMDRPADEYRVFGEPRRMA
jgi:hypothetical protein